MLGYTGRFRVRWVRTRGIVDLSAVLCKGRRVEGAFVKGVGTWTKDTAGKEEGRQEHANERAETCAGRDVVRMMPVQPEAPARLATGCCRAADVN